jgi:3-phosphoshikimate 1-carboxyvinyltransferase
METLVLKPLNKPTITSVDVPGSKSYTNRALLIAAMIKNTVVISKPLFSDDTRAMTGCLEKLGIDLQITENAIRVCGDISQVLDKEYDLNCLLSGTTIRFMLALCTVIPGVQVLYGENRLNERPIADMVDALVELGATIEYLSEVGFPPIRVSSHSLTTKPVRIKGSSSSQYISAMLMIAPLLEGLHITTDGQVVSKPYIDMTLATMNQFGVKVSRNAYETFSISPQEYSGNCYTVEGDISSASYFFAIAVLTKSTITVQNTNPNSIQADMNFLKILERQGNIVTNTDTSITVKGIGPQSLNVDMEHCPDQAATLAVLCAFANGDSTITGIQSLRIKETERVVALEAELAKMNIKTESTESTITIHGGNPRPALIDTYDDHRMAMTFAVAGTKISGITIDNPGVVSKTFPNFWKEYGRLAHASVLPKKNIVLIGLRGSGKTTTALTLGKVLHKTVIDVDQIITAKAGMEIRQIVNDHGWAYFREQELIAISELKDSQDLIIATGGGVVLQRQNIDILKKNGLVFWLQATPATLTERIGTLSNRPALTNKKSIVTEMIEIAKKRDHLYRKAANHIIVTDKLTFTQVADLITRIYKEVIT